MTFSLLSSGESPGRRLLSHETLLWAKTDARVRAGGGGRGVGANSGFQQIWKLAQKLPPAGLLFTAANAREYIWLYFVCCVWSYFLVGHILCAVFGHIFFLDIFSMLYLVLFSFWTYFLFSEQFHFLHTSTT